MTINLNSIVCGTIALVIPLNFIQKVFEAVLLLAGKLKLLFV